MSNDLKEEGNWPGRYLWEEYSRQNTCKYKGSNAERSKVITENEKTWGYVANHICRRTSLLTTSSFRSIIIEVACYLLRAKSGQPPVFANKVL